MSKNTIFVKTAKAGREEKDLSSDHKRLLTYLDGKSKSSELAKRAPPSLRNKWNELLSELVQGGYIVNYQESNIDRRPVHRESVPPKISEPKTSSVSPDNSLDYYSATARFKIDQPEQNKHENLKVRSIQDLDVFTKTRLVSDVEEKPETIEQALKTDRANELKAFFASAKEKANAEAKQTQREAAQAHAEKVAAAISAKERSIAEVKSLTEAKAKKEEATRAHAELEAVILATKTRSDIVTKQSSVSEIPNKLQDNIQAQKEPLPYRWRTKFGGSHTIVTSRMQNLELENESLKKLLVEAYIELETLKLSFVIKS